jgi:importin subunit beta-1
MREYLSSLRVGCVEAYAGIVQGMKGENNNVAGEGNPLLLLASTILNPLQPFLSLIASDPSSSDECITNALGLVGFVFSTLTF